LVAHAISAVDIALWDLKARLHGVPLSTLFGGSRASVPVYGSGGFTNLDDAAFDAQIETWASAGCRAMKIKIGRDRGGDLSWDLARAQRLCAAAPADTALMVDANGAYTVGQACRVGAALDQLGYSWFEEPVTSDDTEGLAAVSHSVRCDVAAGEYANDGYDVAALLDAVDCLQLDVTRCGGYSGFLRWAAMAATRGVEVSGHSAPSLHAPVAAAVPNLRHLEWFVDHARVEPLLVDGTPQVQDGMLPTSGAGEPGHGMTLTKTSPSRA
jgi:L-alanine-DL-glutamate epimerase-like enolase superfamily enzyme